MNPSYLTDLTIDLQNLPNFADFGQVFTERINPRLANLLLDSNDNRLTDIMKTLLRGTVIKQADSQGILRVTYDQRHRLGRFYANNMSSLVVKSKYIKNTMYKYLNYIDLDMVKCHPSIVLSVYKRSGRTIPIFEQYINNFDTICEEIINHYAVEGHTRLVKHQVKWLFNIMLCSGSPESWKNKVIKGGTDKNSGTFFEPVVFADKPFPPIVVQYNQACKNIKNELIKANPGVFELVKDPNKTQWKMRTKY